MMKLMTSARAVLAGARFGLVLDEEAPQLAALGKLEEFASYKDGWAFGDGRRFSPHVVSAARILVTMLKEPIDVFPGRGGDIIVTVYRGQVSYDFIIDSNTRVTVIKECEDGSEMPMQFLHAWREVQLIHPLHLFRSVTPTGSSAIKWNLSDSYTRANMNHNADDLKVQRSSLPALTLGSPVSKSRAPSVSLVASALTP